MTKLSIDCLNLIFNELQDRNSLHSCLLVNREWCRLVVPILWKEYSWQKYLQKKIFYTILSCLQSSSKQLLSDNDIELSSTIHLKSPLFNYISFCKFPGAKIIDNIVEMVFEEEFNKGKVNKKNKRNLLEQELYKLFVSQCKNIKELNWKTLQPLSLFSGASTCFSQLYSLNIDIDFVNSNALYEMSQICKNLNKLIIDNCSQDLPGLISLIEAQRNLKSILIYPNVKKGVTCKELSKALAKKGATINDLHLGPIGAIPPSFLTSFIKLKNITINDGGNIRDEIKDFQHHLAISEFPDLQTITFAGLSCFKELAMLIEKTKGNISEICTYNSNRATENTGMLIKAIANKCPKIKYLHIYIEPKDSIHIKSLLLNCRQLKVLNFYGFDFINENNDNEDVGDELLDILAKFSAISLRKIALSGSWKYSIDIFERFFESCRNRTLSYFAIFPNDVRNYITDDHKAIVRKYIKEGVIISSNLNHL
ncbi:hypothetical protein C1645_880493 [Glomus cerebriforme]|uniref:F-box domain-containing protein n=1 Tax=Glomus cerebriforme TaxID=658196 RepID=A0A397SGU3_9GLOM|nr:hypothetical protein C1645_880493 [Glomus cerebriforme]